VVVVEAGCYAFSEKQFNLTCKTMNEEELREITDLLVEAGVKPQLCDTAVPLSGSTVRCGCPTEPGDVDYSEMTGDSPLS